MVRRTGNALKNIGGVSLELKTPQAFSTPHQKKRKRAQDNSIDTSKQKKSKQNNSSLNETENVSRPKKKKSKKGGVSKQGRRAIKEIQFYQKSHHTLIPKLAFCRIVREIMMYTNSGKIMRIQSNALQALQQATECFIVRRFEHSNLLAIHAKRVTVQPKDMKLVKAILND